MRGMGSRCGGQCTPHGNDRDPRRRLRVGYASSDFREHSVAKFVEPLFGNHDHQRFEIVGYSDVWHTDSTTAMLRGFADQWHEIVGKSDEAVAEMIRGDGIDILVDLAGHTARNRLMVFARKPAPVQISYLGHPGTTGLAAMDYRLTDGLADPMGMTEGFHSERLVRLPKTNWCFAEPRDVPEVGALPVSECGAICFGSFNRLAKLSPRTLDLWARVLVAVPESRLLVKERSLDEQAVRDHLVESFAARGIGAGAIGDCRTEEGSRRAFSVLRAGGYCAGSISVSRDYDDLRGALDGGAGGDIGRIDACFAGGGEFADECWFAGNDCAG